MMGVAGTVFICEGWAVLVVVAACFAWYTGIPSLLVLISLLLAIDGN